MFKTSSNVVAFSQCHCDKLHLVSSQWKKQIDKPHVIGLKNPNWQEADQLFIYKHDQGVELLPTEKQLEVSGQSRTWTHDHSATLPSGSALVPHL